MREYYITGDFVTLATFQNSKTSSHIKHFPFHSGTARLEMWNTEDTLQIGRGAKIVLELIVVLTNRRRNNTNM
jgi:hypothetical protein